MTGRLMSRFRPAGQRLATDYASVPPCKEPRYSSSVSSVNSVTLPAGAPCDAVMPVNRGVGE